MKRTPVTLAIAYVCVAVVVLAVLSMLVQTLDNSETIRQTQQDNRETLDLIKSCTTPGRECFDEGQSRTGEAVASINKVAVYAAACADKPEQQTVEEIERCVRRRLTPALPAPR